MTPQLQIAESLAAGTAKAAARAAEYLLGIQYEPGYWWAELTADTTLESDYVLLQLWLHPPKNGVWNPPTRALVDKAVRSIFERQLHDGGFNVYPQMIEQAIYEHPAVEEVIVIGVPDDYRGEAAKAFVKLRPGAEAFSLDELKAFLAGKLGRHEIPAALEFAAELPKTPVGKLSRHELRNQLSTKQPAQRQQQHSTGGRS